MKAALIFLTLLISTLLPAQSKEIEGIVMDTDSIPIEFANVTSFANDSLVGGGVTDAGGFFRIEVGPECDKLRISSLGYDDLILTAPESNLGTLVLSQSVTALQEVVVKASLISREADRIVLNVAANPLSANKDAQEILQTAPGVWVADNGLSIYGQSGTTLYIDDRKVNLTGNQLMTYLKSIPSSSIATIEIIPQAGAEFSADSAGGVIKINLKRNTIDGLNGSAGMQLTAGEYKQWLNPFVNLSGHSGRWTVNLNGSLNGSPSDRYISHEQFANSSAALSMSSSSQHKEKAFQGNVSIGVFYAPSDSDNLGLQVDYNSNRSHKQTTSETVTESPASQYLTSGFYDSNDRFNNVNVAFNWTRVTDPNGSVLKLISNYNYQSSSVTEDNRMSWSDLPRDSVYATDNLNRYNIFTTDLSFRKVFSPNWEMNIGAKFTFNNVTNRSLHHYFQEEAWIPNRPFDFNSSFDENILALYAAANGKTGRWKFKAGIRGEYYIPDGELPSGSAFDLFPNANVSFGLNERGDYSVAVGYYRNIRRPSFQSLNPVVRQFSDYSYSVGNPNLTPSLTDSFSLNFVLAGKYTVAAGYSLTNNPIRQMFISNTDYPERLYLTWGNEGKDRNAYIHADGFINITKWWNLYSSITYMITSQKLSVDTRFETFSYMQLVAATTFLLPAGFNLSLNCFCNTKMQIGNITVYPILNINPTIQKQFNSHWSASLSLEDMLQRKSKIKTKSTGYERYSYTPTHLTAKINITYKFSTGKSFKTQRIDSATDPTRLTQE
ncbi:MAG: TonB-dependent receptor [Bacteroidales bacterium]|nr:TonB-dependent receptor [Bacteroidales bacterium]